VTGISNKTPANFLESRGGIVLKNVKAKKERKPLSKEVAGKAITEDVVVQNIKEHYESQARKPKGVKRSLEKKENKENDKNNK